jgi:hypothetical protein
MTGIDFIPSASDFPSSTSSRSFGPASMRRESDSTNPCHLFLPGRLRRLHRGVGQRRIAGEPEAHEQANRFVRQFHMPFEPIQLPRQAIEPPRQSGFHPLILIGLQQGHQRRLHHFGARDAAGMSAFLQQFGQFDVEPEGLFAVGLLPHRSMPSSGSSDALRALRFIVRSASRLPWLRHPRAHRDQDRTR